MARSKDPPVPRLFLDSGVWLEGLLAPWNVPRAILIHARRKVFTLILAEYVRNDIRREFFRLLPGAFSDRLHLVGSPCSLSLPAAFSVLERFTLGCSPAVPLSPCWP